MIATCNGTDEWQAELVEWLKDTLRSDDAGYMLRDLRQKIADEPEKELFWAAVEILDTATE